MLKTGRTSQKRGIDTDLALLVGERELEEHLKKRGIDTTPIPFGHRQPTRRTSRKRGIDTQLLYLKGNKK